MPEDFHVQIQVTGGETEIDERISVDKAISEKLVHIFLDDIVQIDGGSDEELEGLLKITAYQGVKYNEPSETEYDYRLTSVGKFVTIFEDDVVLNTTTNTEPFLVSANLQDQGWVLSTFDTTVITVRFETAAGDEISFDVRFVLVAN